MWARRLGLALTIAGLLGQRRPVMAAPADVFISDLVTGGIDCGPNQYAFASGASR